MDGFEKSSLEEDNFGASGGIVKAFDAFPKSKPQYVERTSDGGKWTIAMLFFSILFVWAEVSRWWDGTESHNFAVEKGVSQEMQINLDVVVNMNCEDLHINVQDAVGDRIVASAKLNRDPTVWAHWATRQGVHKLGHDENGRVVTGAGWQQFNMHEEGFGEEHIHDIVSLGKKKAKWSKTPRPRGQTDSCRIFGNMDLNKVQGDFHITARGHGYYETGQHLDHSKFNFSHVVNEFSYGPFYPSLENPLDRTVNLAPANFYKFQYYLSVVPTQYTHGSKTITTNQYAVTEQSAEIGERAIPGIFIKYDIEPIQLYIKETRATFLSFMLKIVNIISGVFVAGHWGFTLTDWARDIIGRKRRSGGGVGMIGSKGGFED
ncbi:unnamed protein product [Clonostachys rosea]|uniref:Endoplasmic reticulum-Golgi intermediate compartment protein n=1 Tax=Bionectria ochroleuca TaxID=29856 RepID=A0ABY6V2E4_BIOOC|nr:unnamed protein product [Clonostachys rosea]